MAERTSKLAFDIVWSIVKDADSRFTINLQINLVGLLLLVVGLKMRAKKCKLSDSHCWKTTMVIAQSELSTMKCMDFDVSFPPAQNCIYIQFLKAPRSTLTRTSNS